MAQSTRAAELIGTISQRSDLISYLVENDKPVSKQTISSDLGLARSTVDEVTRNLREEGLLESTTTGYVPTLFATLVWDAYESFAQSIAEIGASEDDTTPMWPTEAERQEVMGLVAARLDILECARTPHDKRDLVDDPRRSGVARRNDRGVPRSICSPVTHEIRHVPRSSGVHRRTSSRLTETARTGFYR